MSKDAYYFSHDANAHQDPKITRMLLSHKAEGYGIFWIIVEMLRSEEGLSLGKDDYNAIAYQSHSDCMTVASVVENFGLFQITPDGSFFSESLNKRMAEYKEKSAKYRENARKGWEKRAMAMQRQCNGNALKESKVKESKGKESKEAKAPAQTQEAFVLSLKTNPLYKHCDIDREVLKAQQWVSVNPGRKFTQRFFIAWLNRIEAPIISIKNKPQAAF